MTPQTPKQAALDALARAEAVARQDMDAVELLAPRTPLDALRHANFYALALGELLADPGSRPWVERLRAGLIAGLDDDVEPLDVVRAAEDDEHVAEIAGTPDQLDALLDALAGRDEDDDTPPPREDTPR